MKKFIGISLMLVSLLVLGMGSAQAILFTDTVNLGDVTVTDYREYTHTLEIPAGSTLNSASLSLTHRGNSDNGSWLTPELWLAFAAEPGHLLPTALLGDLSNSASNWVTDTFTLSSDVLSLIENHSWVLQVRLGDITLFSDRLSLRSSVINGDYSAPVPEPGSMMLLGSGLMGLLGFGYRKIRS